MSLSVAGFPLTLAHGDPMCQDPEIDDVESLTPIAAAIGGISGLAPSPRLYGVSPSTAVRPPQKPQIIRKIRSQQSFMDRFRKTSGSSSGSGSSISLLDSSSQSNSGFGSMGSASGGFSAESHQGIVDQSELGLALKPPHGFGDASYMERENPKPLWSSREAGIKSANSSPRTQSFGLPAISIAFTSSVASLPKSRTVPTLPLGTNSSGSLFSGGGSWHGKVGSGVVGTQGNGTGSSRSTDYHSDTGSGGPRAATSAGCRFPQSDITPCSGQAGISYLHSSADSISISASLSDLHTSPGPVSAPSNPTATTTTAAIRAIADRVDSGWASEVSDPHPMEVNRVPSPPKIHVTTASVSSKASTIVASSPTEASPSLTSPTGWKQRPLPTPPQKATPTSAKSSSQPPSTTTSPSNSPHHSIAVSPPVAPTRKPRRSSSTRRKSPGPTRNNDLVVGNTHSSNTGGSGSSGRGVAQISFDAGSSTWVIQPAARSGSPRTRSPVAGLSAGSIGGKSNQSAPPWKVSHHNGASSISTKSTGNYHKTPHERGHGRSKSDHMSTSKSPAISLTTNPAPGVVAGENSGFGNTSPPYSSASWKAKGKAKEVMSPELFSPPATSATIPHGITTPTLPASGTTTKTKTPVLPIHTPKPIKPPTIVPKPTLPFGGSGSYRVANPDEDNSSGDEG